MNSENNNTNREELFYENFLTEQKKESNSTFPSQKARTSVKMSLTSKPLLDTIHEIEGGSRLSLVDKMLEEYVEKHYPKIINQYYAGELKYQKRMREDGLL